MEAAIEVAWARPSQPLRRARSTRPPSIGNAGIRLNRPRARFTSNRLSTNPSSHDPYENSASPSVCSPRSDGDDAEIHRGAGQGDQELRSRGAGHPPQSGHAADRVKRDIFRLDPEPACHQGMAQLMQEDAPEECEHEQDGQIAGEEENEQERRVKEQVDSGDPSEFP